ncbi:hypothetical protein BD779DRAFT_1497640 [Infundibulicybe gibba]|nr:hypothetical protein BD779DRAFT_1497640 [Infundibulicybe gibba]
MADVTHTMRYLVSSCWVLVGYLGCLRGSFYMFPMCGLVVGWSHEDPFRCTEWGIMALPFHTCSQTRSAPAFRGSPTEKSPIFHVKSK